MPRNHGVQHNLSGETHQIEDPIGVFDSGVGGLTVVAQLRRLVPYKPIVYFGDTARVPYGTKSKETITRFALQDVQFLLSHGVGLISAACHSVSSNSLGDLSMYCPVPLIGVIDPGARAACESSRTGRIGVIGTMATVESRAYRKTIAGIDPDITVIERCCPLFVPLAEEGWIDRAATRLIAEEYLEPLKREDVDTLILGCTHYPLLRTIIAEVMGPEVTLIDCAEAVSREVQRVDTTAHSRGSVQFKKDRFYLSDVPRNFIPIAERFLGAHIGPVTRVDLDDYPDLSIFESKHRIQPVANA
jgi:glutamate racemase